MNEFYSYEIFSFMTRNFANYNQKFIVLDSTFKYDTGNVIKTKKGFFRYLVILYYLLVSRKIIFHGLFDPRLKLLMMMFIVKSKFYWVIWGADLYDHMFYKFSFKAFVIKHIDRILYPKIINIVSFNKFDYELLQKKFSSNRKTLRKFYYAPYFVPYIFSSLNLNKEFNSKKKTFLVGNSASVTNNHIECFNKLFSEVDNYIAKVIVPLSYGDIDYRDKIIDYGRRLFGDRFEPIIDYMDHEKHVKILSEVDEAIFFHDRQQALSTIIDLIALGKKVYIKSTVTTYMFFSDNGINIYDAIENFNKNINQYDSNTLANNISILKDIWAEKTLVELWSYVLE